MSDLLELEIAAPTSDDAYARLQKMAEEERESGLEETPFLQRAAARTEAEELAIPQNIGVKQFLQWVAENLDSEEGVMDEDTPRDIRRVVRRAVELLNDPMLPSPCVRVGDSWERRGAGEDVASTASVEPTFIFLERA